MLDIIRVRTETDAAEVRLMVAEFFDWMRDLYPEGAEERHGPPGTSRTCRPSCATF